MRRWGFRTHVLVVALIPALAIALLLGFYFAQVRFVDLERSLNERGLAIVRQLASAAEYGVFSGNREVLDRLVASVSREADVTAVAIRDAQGNILAQQGPVMMPLVHALARGVPIQSAEDGGRILISCAPILQSRVVLKEFFDANRNGNRHTREPPVARELGRVYVAMSREALLARRNRLLLDTLGISLLILVGGAFLALRMSRGITRPVVKLTAAVQKIADGDLDARVTLDSEGAIRALEDGVNTMATALKSAHADLERRIAAATAELNQKREEAERANEAKSRFLAAASHDLRQPLHALGLYVAALRDRQFSDDARRLVGQIDKSASMMQDLLEALLDISRLDAGAIRPHVADFPVSALLARLETSYVPPARAKGVLLRVATCRASVRSDPVLLERIVLNLVSNAVRYTRHGTVLVGCRRRRGALRIEVWDTGCGISEDQQRLIFDEFHRVGGHEPDAEKGHGLGLAIVDRLGRLLGHAVELWSTLGKGSMFAVTVPLAAGNTAGEDQVEKIAGAGVSMANARVMVIDDDPAALKATQTLLENWGCRVLTAASGDKALARCLAVPRLPDVVICDYRLGAGETGVQVAHRFQITFPDRMRLILVTGDASAEVARCAQEAGYPLLHKPVRPAKLRALLDHCLRACVPANDERR